MTGEGRRSRRLLVEFAAFVGVVAVLVVALVLLPDDSWGHDVRRVVRVAWAVSFVVGLAVLIGSCVREFRRGLTEDDDPTAR